MLSETETDYVIGVYILRSCSSTLFRYSVLQLSTLYCYAIITMASYYPSVSLAR